MTVSKLPRKTSMLQLYATRTGNRHRWSRRGTTIIMATHNKEIVKKLNKRIIELNKGEMINDKSHKETKVHEEEKKEEHAPHESHHKDEKHEEGKADDKIKTDDFEEALK